VPRHSRNTVAPVSVLIQFWRSTNDDDAVFLTQVDGELEPSAPASGRGGQQLAEMKVAGPYVRQPQQDPDCGRRPHLIGFG